MAKESPPQYNIGDKLKTTGQEIKSIIGISDRAGVFITSDNSVRWEWYEDQSLLNEIRHNVINKYDSMAFYIMSSMPSSKAPMFQRQLASALCHALNTVNVSDSIHAFSELEKDFLKKAQSYASSRYVIGSLSSGLLLILIASLSILCTKESCHYLSLGFVAGVVGAILSVLTRSYKLSIDKIAHLWLAAFQGGIRTLLGGIFGLVMVISIKANIVMGFLSPYSFESSVGAIMAGFSERFIPDLLDRLEKHSKK